MKTFFLFIITLISSTVFAQTENFSTLITKGKEAYSKAEYVIAANYFEKAVLIIPKSAEAHYYLGYCYSKINSFDGKGLTNSSLQQVLKSSLEFELVNKLSPKYKGKLIVQDPYSKLSSEWGSLAISYIYNNKTDSAIWAFKEGKKRGGFSDFILSVNKSVLDLCDKNAILVTSGDNYIFPLWYLQYVENYRMDVSVVDISLLNTYWYPSFLSNNKKVQFDFPNNVLDSVEYCEWPESTVKVNEFSWVVKPSYENLYLLRGDRVFLSMLRENKFERTIYFSSGFSETDQVGLKAYLTPNILIDKVNINSEEELDFNTFKEKFIQVSQSIEKLNKNSELEMRFAENIRLILLIRISEESKSNQKELFKILDTYFNEKKLPIKSTEIKNYLNELRKEYYKK
jgi:hypothetical protein